MSCVPTNPDIIGRIVAEWRTGEYSQQDLAVRNKVSKGLVNKHTKGVEQDMVAIVTAGVSYKQALATQSDRMVTAMTEVVDERTKDLIFIRRASLIVAQKAVHKVQQEDCTMQDLRHAQEVIGKGKENIYGKAPETAIQINNAVTSVTYTIIDPRA